jgi:hypothetical protein
MRSKDGTTGGRKKIHTGEPQDLLLNNQIGVNELGATYSNNWDTRKGNKSLVGKTTFAS